MTFDIFFNLLGLPWPFEIDIKVRQGDLVCKAILESGGSKMAAIKELRWLSPEYIPLKEAKAMIETQWYEHR
jgi:hypothetical protein